MPLAQGCLLSLPSFKSFIQPDRTKPSEHAFHLTLLNP